MQAVAITSAFSPAIDVLSTLATALVIGYGGYLVFAGSLSVGVLTAFLIYVQQFFRPIQLASQVYTQAQAAVAGAERIYNILDEEPEPADPPNARKLGPARGRISFEHVTFAYDPGRPVLHDVDFVVEPGQTVALVGPTGAGKTTIASLIPRFYDATEGTVRIDGRDVREMARKNLRANIGIVLQEPFLFSGTIAENIGYGRSGDPAEATREEVEAAARVVNAHGFIMDLPDGYDTVLGEGGGALSQGQRQLLSFARAVLTDPRILILDEATSNIDTRTEAIIQRALATLLEGRTSVVIAHRLSTIRNADLILVSTGRQHRRARHPRRPHGEKRPLRGPLPPPVPRARSFREEILTERERAPRVSIREDVSGIGRREESRMGVIPERILLATDGSEDAARATKAASDLASKSGAELHVVHVWHDVRGFAHDFVKRELRRQGPGGARRASREDKGRGRRGREGASPRGPYL